MASDTINKNMILKSMILKKHLGLFKSIVKKHQQLNSFLNYSKKQIAEINSVIYEPIKIKKIKDVIEYFYNTRDIWAGNELISDCFKHKIIKFSQEKPIFKEYLSIFGYNCPHPKSDGSICYEHVLNNRLCYDHKKLLPQINSEILSSLPEFPKDICDIVFKYTMPYKQH
jgi:hypothetical protein